MKKNICPNLMICGLLLCSLVHSAHAQMMADPNIFEAYSVVTDKELSKNPLLEDYIENLNDHGEMIITQVKPPIYKLHSQEFSSLFPQVNIYYVRTWSSQNPDYKIPVSIIGPMQHILIVDEQGNIGPLDFEKLIVQRNIKLDSEEMAQKLWDIFILAEEGVDHKVWNLNPDAKFKKVSDQEWHLGLYEGEQINNVGGVDKSENHYQVLTDENRIITSWGMMGIHESYTKEGTLRHTIKTVKGKSHME